MVYCGKPSRGCQMCRTRRIKCDETKPTCSQCRKSRRQCPGYKDDFDLVFRNETQATERRARRVVNNGKRSSSQTFINQEDLTSYIDSAEGSSAIGSHPLIEETTDSSMVIVTPMNPAKALSIPLEQQAPSYFITNFITSPRATARAYLDFLVPLLKTDKPDSQLALAFSAVSIASLANRPNVKGGLWFGHALAHYIKALKAVNLALQNPAEQRTDHTLGAILLLGFFENVASESSNASAWYSHVEGAVQLVKMRGKKQLRTKIGYALFICVRTQMIIQCMSSSKPPPLGADWWLIDPVKDQFGLTTVKLTLRIAELRAEINHALGMYPRNPEHFRKVLDLLRRAQAMETEYVAWEDMLTEEWCPRTVSWVDQIPAGDVSKADIFPGKVEMYTDIWVANVWNHTRVARLFVWGAIVRCAAWICSPVDYRTTPEYAQAARICADLVTDIIASTPYLLGWRMREDGTLEPGNYTGIDVASPKAIGGFFCLWPLFSITNTDYITDSQRQWAKGRLLFVSEVFGLRHAKVLSGFQLRLPSMIIRRDAMVHTAPSLLMPSARAIYPSLTIKSGSTSSPPGAIISPPNKFNGDSVEEGGNYALNPLQQREAMQRETWENERRALLTKAANSQGDSVERLLANYLAV